MKPSLVSSFAVFFVFTSLALFLPTSFARNRYIARVPNSQSVVVNGQRIRALGHKNPNSGSASRSSANPFGLDVDDRDNIAEFWPNVCQLDSDADGRTNGVELCDPDCVWNSNLNDPVCLNGLILTHPGIVDDGSGNAVLQLGAVLSTNLKVHASLMIIAWCILAPVGILFAIFEKKAGNGPTWFKVHRAFLLSTTFCTIIGFIALILEIRFASIQNDIQHAKLGLSVVVLSALQPLSGFFRAHLPKKGEKKSSERLLWEFQHQWTGRIIMFLAVASLITGIEIGFLKKGPGLFLAVVFFLITVVSFVFVLIFRDGPIGKKKRDSIKILEKPQQQQQQSFPTNTKDTTNGTKQFQSVKQVQNAKTGFDRNDKTTTLTSVQKHLKERNDKIKQQQQQQRKYEPSITKEQMYDFI